jgi:FkbM family methyltransferase
MPELCGAGWTVGFELLWHDSQGAWAAKPRIVDIVDAMEIAYGEARGDDMRAKAFAFAEQYDANIVAEMYWRPALEKFEARLAERAAEVASAPSREALKTRIVEHDGLLWIDRGAKTGDGIGWQDHEKELWPILDGLLPEGGTFLDVGAHVGHWTMRLAAKAGRVVSVEANPETASTLRRNLAMNDIRNVLVVELAAWDERRMLALDDPGHQIEGGSTRVVPIASDKMGQPVIQADRLDARLRHELTALDLVKIDVEGADIHVIDGMRGLLDRFRPVLFIECHDIYGYYERADLEAALTNAGYVWTTAHSYASYWMPTGIVNEPKLADYLVATPKERTPDNGQAKGRDELELQGADTGPAGQPAA